MVTVLSSSDFLGNFEESLIGGPLVLSAFALLVFISISVAYITVIEVRDRKRRKNWAKK